MMCQKRENAFDMMCQKREPVGKGDKISSTICSIFSEIKVFAKRGFFVYNSANG